MVPYLHQSKIYIKRKLCVWRVQKCIPLVGAQTSLTCAGLETTPSQVSKHMDDSGNFCKSGSTISHGTVFTPKQCLSQKEATGMESPKMYSSRRCKNLTYLCRTVNDPSHVSKYRAENGNLRKSGSTFIHGTVFAPKQCLFQKEAAGMESPKMYSSSWCINLTYLCGTANDPVSSRPVEGRERRFAEIRLYL